MNGGRQGTGKQGPLGIGFRNLPKFSDEQSESDFIHLDELDDIWK